ncbi:MAG: class I SAM-dependent methyltransferase family protein [Thermoproteota archaeon]|nr:MAG: class I SAM-dependent methyltransferase family protein [Candidatus Korarchaeota archaeon]RLG49658.1 MAG: class I SAM-dependent methyltransferase family protein [Candidatus Korarchaeota archaeon]
MRFDLIGSRESGAVAILHVEDDEDPKKAAEEIMRRYKHVKSVLLRVGPRSGTYRLRPLVLLIGDKNTEVIHKEHGYRLKLDPMKVYFSPREATERELIAKQVSPGEKVLVMFAGVGPFAIAIARFQPKVKEIIGVEINEIAYKYFLENVKMNKVEDKVRPILGDVREVCPPMFCSFNRVLMPLPKEAYEYLDLGLRSLKGPQGILHFYYWGGEEAYQEAIELVKQKAQELDLKAEPLFWRRVSAYSPRKWKIRVDFHVTIG